MKGGNFAIEDTQSSMKKLIHMSHQIFKIKRKRKIGGIQLTSGKNANLVIEHNLVKLIKFGLLQTKVCHKGAVIPS